jgi:hypothetical protein
MHSASQLYELSQGPSHKQPGCGADVGAPGRGGEYEVVAGFGWTNGVALSFLEKYGWRGGSEPAS